MDENKSASAEITIDRDFFEHLLNCLANQKFINEPPNADGIAMGEKLCKEEKKLNQETIDKTWNKGMFILNS